MFNETIKLPLLNALIISDDNHSSSSSSANNDLREEDVERVLISLLSTNSPLSYGASTQEDNERTRGGERDTKTDFISERTMDILLREMRKMDRDRDRVLHPIQIKTLFSKYKV